MKGKRSIIIVAIVVALIVAAFAYVSIRTPKTVESTKEISELDELMSKNIQAVYPATPREVIKLYNRYVLYLHGENNSKLSDDEVHKLGAKMRDLYDAELLEVNPEDTYFMNLNSELASYRDRSKVMLQANVCDSNEVEFIDINGAEGALAQASYFCKEGSKDFTRTYQQYLLRKDSNGNWKILGFVKMDGGTES